MKNKLTKYLIVLAISACLSGVTSISQAYYGNGGGCRWIPGHSRGGHWIPGHKVCGGRYYNNRCVFIPGHWYHGYWVRPHQFCR